MIKKGKSFLNKRTWWAEYEDSYIDATSDLGLVVVGGMVLKILINGECNYFVHVLVRDSL